MRIVIDHVTKTINYTYLLVGATCHHGRRRGTSHLKRYYSRKKDTNSGNDISDSCSAM